MQPLTGVRVIDVTQIMAGPFCTMLLGDMGADVIKIEKPDGGDDVRRSGPPFVAGESATFLNIGRNKRSVVIDMKRPEGGEHHPRHGEGRGHLRAESSARSPGRLRAGVRRHPRRQSRHHLRDHNRVRSDGALQGQTGVRPHGAGTLRHHERDRPSWAAAREGQRPDHRPQRRTVHGIRDSGGLRESASRPAWGSMSTRP